MTQGTFPPRQYLFLGRGLGLLPGARGALKSGSADEYLRDRAVEPTLKPRPYITLL